MNKLAYPIFIWKSHRGLLAFATLLCAALQLLIVVLISGMDTRTILAVLMEQLPKQFQSFISEQFLTTLSLKGAAAFGFKHPIVLTLLVIVAITLPFRHITSELETGTLELLLAYPVRRSRLLLQLWAAGSFAIFGILGVTLAASLATITVTGNLTAAVIGSMVQIAGNLSLLMVLIMSYTMLLATYGQPGSKVGMLSAGITLIFYLLDLVASLWEPLSVVAPLNIFSYFQPQDLILGEADFVTNALVLSSLILICVAVSLRQFTERDIPG